MAQHTILVPVDFSDASREAARLAASLARQQGCELLVFHVNELPDVAMMATEPIYVPPRAWTMLAERKAEHIEREMARLAAEIDVPFSTAHRRGHTVDAITQFARETETDLIVMGSQGEGGGAQFLFGSVAAKVSREAPCPVLIVKPGAMEVAQDGEFRRAVVGIDYGPGTERAARLASKLVAANGSIACVHVWQQPGYFQLDRAVQGGQSEFAADLERAREIELERLQAVVDDLALPQPEVAAFLDIGSPAQELLARVRSLDADLIVLGSHSRHGVERVLGTVADRVLRHASVPVLLVPTSSLPSS